MEFYKVIVCLFTVFMLYAVVTNEHETERQSNVSREFSQGMDITLPFGGYKRLACFRAFLHAPTMYPNHDPVGEDFASAIQLYIERCRILVTRRKLRTAADRTQIRRVVKKFITRVGVPITDRRSDKRISKRLEIDLRGLL